MRWGHRQTNVGTLSNPSIWQKNWRQGWAHVAFLKRLETTMIRADMYANILTELNCAMVWYDYEPSQIYGRRPIYLRIKKKKIIIYFFLSKQDDANHSDPPSQPHPPTPTPRGRTLTWWGCSCFWHKPTNLACQLLSVFCCVYFCLYGPFNCISFRKLSKERSALSLCSFFRSYFCFIGPFIYTFLYKVSFSSDIIPCGWLGSKHHLTY